MNCKECQSVLEEYFDRELERDLDNALARHLEECAVCAAELNRMTAEQGVFQRYASEVELPQDLWTGIQARLVDQPGKDRTYATSETKGLARLFALPRLSLPVAATLVLAAAVLTVVVMKTMNAPERQLATVANERNAPVAKIEPAQPASALPVELKANEAKSDVNPKASLRGSNIGRHITVPATPATKTAEQLVREAERKYLAAINMLAHDVDRNQSRIDPDTKMKLDQALASIDRTIAATRKVVLQRPDDPVAAQYLLSAYARKVDALREMATGAF